jgi:translation initiation factor eIF-2B subunit epsilon
MSNKTAKAKKKGSEGNAGAESDKREQKLQAVLMADSFTSTFRPLSWEIPKVLMPLANVPMLEYTVEFLTQNGVEEILVVCVWHAKLVQKFVDNLVSTKNVAVRCIPMPGCRSAGDALRELDTLGLVRSDPFVLISGDVVANIDLKKVSTGCSKLPSFY